MNEFTEPRALAEIHKIRLENYERTKDMTPEERLRLLHEETDEIVKRLGIDVVTIPDRTHERKRM